MCHGVSQVCVSPRGLWKGSLGVRFPSQGTVGFKTAQAFKAPSCAALRGTRAGQLRAANPGEAEAALATPSPLPSLAFPATGAPPQPHTEPQIWEGPKGMALHGTRVLGESPLRGEGRGTAACRAGSRRLRPGRTPARAAHWSRER